MKLILAIVCCLLMLGWSYQQCPTGLLSCGISCYSSSQYVCNQPGNHLCPIDHPNSCGTACYASSQFHCVNGQLVPGPAPEPTESIVTGPPPSGNCPTGLFACGTACYSTSQYVCNQPGNHLCPIDHPNSCGVACYSPTQFHCVNGQLVPGAAPSPGPSPSPSPQPTESIVTGPPSGCPGTEQSCGGQCYSSSLYTCIQGAHLCPCADPCYCPGDNACFNDAQFNCCATTAFPNGHLTTAACASGGNRAVCNGTPCT